MFNLSVDFVRFLLVFYIVFLFIQNVKQVGKKHDKNWKQALLSHTFSGKGLLDLLVIFLFILQFVLFYLNIDEHTDELYAKETFYDFSIKGTLYMQAIITNAFFFLFTFIRLFEILALNTRVMLLKRTLGAVSKKIIAYMVILIPVFVGWTLIAMGIYGPYYSTFKDFRSALIAILMLIVGFGDIMTML